MQAVLKGGWRFVSGGIVSRPLALAASSLAVFAVIFAAAPPSGSAMTASWCDSLGVRLAQNSTTSLTTSRLGILLSNSLGESLFISDVRGQFSWSSDPTDWGGISLGAGESGYVTAIVASPSVDRKQTYALVLNITGRAASEPSSSSCRVVGALKVIRPAYPSTGFEGLTLWVFFGYSLVGIVTLVVVVVALLLLRRPPVYRPPPPPLGRCPQCGEPLVPELAGAPWKCPRCGWQ